MQEKINTLRSLLPNSPFVAEQVGMALKFAMESEATEEEKVNVLDTAIYLTKLANDHSHPDFYNYRPIVCVLLQLVSDGDKLQMFATETNSVLVTLAELNTFKEKLAEDTKDATIYFSQAIMNKTDLPVVGFALLKELVKVDKVTALKAAYLSLNIALSHFEFTGATYVAYNDMLIEIEQAKF